MGDFTVMGCCIPLLEPSSAALLGLANFVTIIHIVADKVLMDWEVSFEPFVLSEREADFFVGIPNAMITSKCVFIA